MKFNVKIPKSRLSAPVDFGEVIASRRVLDTPLEYEEYDFMQTDGSVVLYDAYSSAHKYAPLDFKSGVIAFPYCLNCVTDRGERVAYCGLRFSEEPIAEWIPICSDAEKARLGVDPEAAAVPIASGVCCISSAEAYGIYRSHLKDEVHPLSGLIVLDGQTHIEVELYGKKYAVFSTGWGDGRFKCYKGVTAAGNVAQFIVDFGMIEYPKPVRDETVDVEIESDNVYLVDPRRSEPENNVMHWTRVLENAVDPISRLRAYSRRGYAYHSLNDTENALSDYIHAVEECRYVKDRGELLRAWSVYDNAAAIYEQKSDYEAAIDLMTKALKVGDNFYASAYVRLIDLYQLTKRTDKAMEIAERMLNNRPNDPVANMKYAEVCVAAMEYAKAARTYERLASSFRLYENLFDGASCLIELGDLDGADAALERHPSKEYNEQYWYYKAYIDFKKRRYSDALKKAERSHDIDGEYMPALYLLIDTHSIMQEYHAVARYAEEYKKLRPDKEYGYSICGEAQLILGNYSESSKNYGYLYEAIKKDDKYAALAAVTAAKMGDSKRKRKLLKALRRKKSEYYGGAIYALYITKYRKRGIALSKVVYNLKTSDDFLLCLAIYLAGTDNVLPATRILDVLYKRNTQSFEVVAQQIRTAVKLGDDKLFDKLFDFYMEHYAGEVTESDRELIAERFKLVGTLKHLHRKTVNTETPEALGIVMPDKHSADTDE